MAAANSPIANVLRDPGGDAPASPHAVPPIRLVQFEPASPHCSSDGKIWIVPVSSGSTVVQITSSAAVTAVPGGSAVTSNRISPLNTGLASIARPVSAPWLASGAVESIQLSAV